MIVEIAAGLSAQPYRTAVGAGTIGEDTTTVVAVNSGIGPDKFAIRACNRKACQFISAFGDQSAAQMREPQTNCATLHVML